MSAKRIYNWERNWCRGGSGLFRQSCTTTIILRAPGRSCRRGGDSREGTNTIFRSCVWRHTGWRRTKRKLTGLRSGWTGKWRCLIKGGGQHFGATIIAFLKHYGQIWTYTLAQIQLHIARLAASLPAWQQRRHPYIVFSYTSSNCFEVSYILYIRLDIGGWTWARFPPHSTFTKVLLGMLI